MIRQLNKSFKKINPFVIKVLTEHVENVKIETSVRNVCSCLVFDIVNFKKRLRGDIACENFWSRGCQSDARI
jgi:hypothetical protein